MANELLYLVAVHFRFLYHVLFFIFFLDSNLEREERGFIQWNLLIK